MRKTDGHQMIEGRNAGYVYGILAFTAWGLLPVFWKLLDGLSAEEILANRIIWSFVFVACILLWTGEYRKVKESLLYKKNVLLILVASLIISLNWFTYIWAVNFNHVVQASLGYFMNPLVVSVLSITVVKEKFNNGQYTALVLALIGVAVMTFQYGGIPWVAVTLAVTFAFYGLIKKYLQMDSVISMALETLAVTPFALGYLIYRTMSGTGNLTGLPPITIALLLLSGVVTATPLVWFTRSTQLIKFSSVGFLQYIAPTISLLIGVFVFKEEFNPGHLVSFSFIWAALAVYTFSTVTFDYFKTKGTAPGVRAQGS